MFRANKGAGMPVIGILELIAIACAVHAVRTGRAYYWI
jgi:hypothetical protein